MGPDIYGHLTPTMNLMNSVINNNLPFDPVFSINFVDVKDVAKGMMLAAQRGKPGSRYILATEPSITTTDIIHMAKEIYPETVVPTGMPKDQLLSIAEKMEKESAITGQAPFLLVNNVEHYYGADARIDISKARSELGYAPRDIKEVINDTFRYLKNKSNE